MRSAGIYYEQQNYDEAIQNYLQAASSTSNQREVVLAQEGLIKAYYFKGNYDKTLEYADKIILEGGNTVLGATNRATLYKGKAMMQKKNITRLKLSLSQ